MSAGELDMEKTDFSMTNATTFDHHSAQITAFFIQASGCIVEARCGEGQNESAAHRAPCKCDSDRRVPVLSSFLRLTSQQLPALSDAFMFPHKGYFAETVTNISCALSPRQTCLCCVSAPVIVTR